MAHPVYAAMVGFWIGLVTCETFRKGTSPWKIKPTFQQRFANCRSILEGPDGLQPKTTIKKTFHSWKPSEITYPNFFRRHE